MGRKIWEGVNQKVTTWPSLAAFLFVFALVGSFFAPQFADASGPSVNLLLNYQARLTDASGTPLFPDTTGSKNVKFLIYDSANVCQWTARGTCGAPTAKSVTMSNGVFSTLLGESGDVAIPENLFSASANPNRFLEVQIETSTPGTYETLSPKKRIVSSAYAANANLLDDLDTSSVGGSVAFVPVTDSSGNLTLTLQTPYQSGKPWPPNTNAVDPTDADASCEIQPGSALLPFHQPIPLPSGVVIDLDYSSPNVAGLWPASRRANAPSAAARVSQLCMHVPPAAL